MNKYPTSIRLSDRGKQILEKLADKHGVSQGNIMEIALRMTGKMLDDMSTVSLRGQLFQPERRRRGRPPRATQNPYDSNAETPGEVG